MQNIDAEQFGRLLAETSEVFGQRPLTAGAQRRWFEILRDVPFERVNHAMRAWMVRHKKMPSPADLVDLTAVPKQHEERVATFAPRVVTEAGERSLALIRRHLEQPRPPSKKWAHDILAAHQLGVPLMYTHPMTGERLPVTSCPITQFQVRFAQDALKDPAVRAGLRERVPGEDDE